MMPDSQLKRAAEPVAQTPFSAGIVSGRRTPEAYGEDFADLSPPLDVHAVQVAADRCYFCHDAPCVTACPTGIDIPLFIREIATGMPEAAARTIFDSNILGGACARVCPTETLCEGACVREAAEGQPVQIGLLQRHATDKMMAHQSHPYTRAADTGKSVAVVGAGPAGLACAHRLAMKGHKVTIYDARPKPGGLNEYGIAAYKMPGGFAQKEVDWLLQIGGISIVENWSLGRVGDGDLDVLRADHDAVFLAIGLSGVRALGAPGEDLEGVVSATDFIAELRQTHDLSQLPIGRDVVVIGGGMTAIDAAVQAKLLGALNVTILYRRTRAEMPASDYEQELALSKGVRIIENAVPVALVGEGKLSAVDCAYTRSGSEGLIITQDTFTVPAEQCFKAIGQVLGTMPEGPAVRGGKIITDGAGRTDATRVWAGGDCTHAGDDLTVTAVAQGRDAAENIHTFLMEG